MTGSLKDRLAAKAARRVTLPIATRDPLGEFEDLQRTTVALSIHPKDGDLDELARLTAEHEAAQAAYDAVFVEVEFQALSAADYEAVLDQYLDPDSAEDGEELVSDWAQALPDLVAACCVDPELQDVEWWREQFAKDVWSAGDKVSLRIELIRLNTEIPVRAPKG